MKQYNSHKSMMKNGYRENQLYLEALIGLNKSKKVEKFIENNYHLPANSAFDKLLLKSEENGLIVDMAINEIKKQPYNYELYRPPKVRPKNLTIGGRYFYGKIQL